MKKLDFIFLANRELDSEYRRHMDDCGRNLQEFPDKSLNPTESTEHLDSIHPREKGNNKRTLFPAGIFGRAEGNLRLLDPPVNSEMPAVKQLFREDIYEEWRHFVVRF